MKKFMLGAAALALTIMIGGTVFTGGPFTVTAEAAAVRTVCTQHTKHCTNHTDKNCTFKDKNKDGICDKCNGHKAIKKSKQKNCVKVVNSHHSKNQGSHHH